MAGVLFIFRSRVGSVPISHSISDDLPFFRIRKNGIILSELTATSYTGTLVLFCPPTHLMYSCTYVQRRRMYALLLLFYIKRDKLNKLSSSSLLCGFSCCTGRWQSSHISYVRTYPLPSQSHPSLLQVKDEYLDNIFVRHAFSFFFFLFFIHIVIRHELCK